MKKQTEFDLTDPKQAREFLKSAPIGPNGSKVTHLWTESGKQLTVDEASDEQILGIVANLYQKH